MAYRMGEGGYVGNPLINKEGGRKEKKSPSRPPPRFLYETPLYALGLYPWREIALLLQSTLYTHAHAIFEASTYMMWNLLYMYIVYFLFSIWKRSARCNKHQEVLGNDFFLFMFIMIIFWSNYLPVYVNQSYYERKGCSHRLKVSPLNIILS